MNRIRLQEDWFDRLLPEGIPIPGAILLSGPGGTGKPLIGNILVSAWLRQGGSVVFLSLQYPDHRFIAAGLKMVNQLDLDKYQDRVAYIELDASLDGIGPIDRNRIQANVVIPEIWDDALGRAYQMVPDEGPGILVFGSALNLLLFSPTYGSAILEKMKSALKEDHPRTYLFSASTTAKAKEIAELEAVSKNLIMTRSTKSPFRLFMKLERFEGVPYLSDEVEVPIPDNVLMDVKEIADHSRKRVIPLVSTI